MLRHPWRGVERNGGPDRVGVLFGDAVAAQKIPSGMGAIDLEALILAAVARHQADVVEHRARVEELTVELQPSANSRQRAEMIDAARMIEEQVGLGLADKFSDGARQLAVRNGSSFDNLRHDFLLNFCSPSP